jgi:hypothetical protein
VRRVAWERNAVLAELRGDVWRYLTQAAERDEELELEAAALLQMREGEVRRLAAVHFLLSEEVARLLSQMPSLVRRLATTTVVDEEWSLERVRGPIRWGPTLGARAATGLPHLYITAPADRAFQTPENEVLVHALDAISDAGSRTQWGPPSRSGVGLEVRDRVARSDHWLQTRMLSSIDRYPVDGKMLNRIRAGRSRRRYQSAIDVAILHDRLMRRVDRQAVREAIEQYGLATRDDPTLLELKVAFGIERALREQGWSLTLPGLVSGGRLLHAQREGRRLDVYYQTAPARLEEGSHYGHVQRTHAFAPVGSLRPDFVLHEVREGRERWLLLEVKGVERAVKKSARAATLGLLAYRRAFDPALMTSWAPYGLGVAWGAELAPTSGSEIMLCTPDTLPQALELILA